MYTHTRLLSQSNDEEVKCDRTNAIHAPRDRILHVAHWNWDSAQHNKSINQIYMLLFNIRFTKLYRKRMVFGNLLKYYLFQHQACFPWCFVFIYRICKHWSGVHSKSPCKHPTVWWRECISSVYLAVSMILRKGESNKPIVHPNDRCCKTMNILWNTSSSLSKAFPGPRRELTREDTTKLGEESCCPDKYVGIRKGEAKHPFDFW